MKSNLPFKSVLRMNSYHQYQIEAMNQEESETIFTNCELCKVSLPLEDTLAGTFQRICRNCFGYQVEAMFEPLHYIGDGVYLGNEDAHRNEEVLKKHEIGAILTCAGELKPHKYENLEVERKSLDLKDYQGQSICQHFEEAIQWIQSMVKANKKVLIHCAAGVSRSGSFTIAYFMSTKDLSFRDAFLMVKSQRRCVKPNSGFHEQLLKFQEKLQEKKKAQSQ